MNDDSLKNFSRIVCVSLFSYQCSLLTALSSSSSIIPNLFQLVKNFFKKFLKFFELACRLTEATLLSYHTHFSLSTIIFYFFKTFQIVDAEETISCDSSVRITLSNRAVNTFFNFFIFYFEEYLL